MKTISRHVGFCQICENQQKLLGDCLVHHGYTRPGDGQLWGDCPGVGEPSYELSCDYCKEYIEGVRKRHAAFVEDENALSSGKVTSFLATEKHWDRAPQLVEYAVGVTEPFIWRNKIQARIYQAQSDIRHLDADIKRLEKRISDWKPIPRRTINEAVAEEKAANEARAAVRTAAREERAAEVAATRTKQADLEARREAIRKDFRDKFVAFSLVNDREAAMTLYWKLSQKQYVKWLWTSELKCDDALISLGLAWKDDTFTRYK